MLGVWPASVGLGQADILEHLAVLGAFNETGHQARPKVLSTSCKVVRHLVTHFSNMVTLPQTAKSPHRINQPMLMLVGIT